MLPTHSVVKYIEICPATDLLKCIVCPKNASIVIKIADNTAQGN